MKLADALDAWTAAEAADHAMTVRLRRAGWARVRARWLRLLQGIADHPGGTATEIARVVKWTTGNVSYELARLGELGLVDARAAPHDRRASRLELTEQGHALLAAMEADEP